MSKVLKELFQDDDLYDRYQNMWTHAVNLLSNCKKLYEINNFMDLDRSLEQTHEAKISIDYSLNLLEQIWVNKSIELKWLKDENKNNKLRAELSFDSTNKKMKDDCSMKEYEKKRERAVALNIKTKTDEQRELECDIEIIKIELKHAERTRENISDVYMSIKKKYDALIKLGIS